MKFAELGFFFWFFSFSPEKEKNIPRQNYCLEIRTIFALKILQFVRII